MKNQLKELKKLLKETEKRAILAERTVKKLIKEVDSKEGAFPSSPCKSSSLASPIFFFFYPVIKRSPWFCRRVERGEGQVQLAVRRARRDLRRAFRILNKYIKT